MLGATALTVCIYFLPKFMGVNSLIVGLFLNYGISATLNFALLNKVMPVKPKYYAFIALSALSVAPTALFGSYLYGILRLKLGVIISLALSASAAAGFQYALLLSFGLVQIKKRFKGFTSDKIGKRTKKSA